MKTFDMFAQSIAARAKAKRRKERINREAKKEAESLKGIYSRKSLAVLTNSSH